MAYTNIEDLRSTLDDEEFMNLINQVYLELRNDRIKTSVS